MTQGLTERESEILRHLTAGEANKEIAVTLRISVHTVERHLANLFAKIGARNPRTLRRLRSRVGSPAEEHLHLHDRLHGLRHAAEGDHRAE